MRQTRTFEGDPVPIVTDGLQSSRTIGEGRWIPILVLDAHGRPDLQELFVRSPDSPPGDVKTQWARPKRDKDWVILYIEFGKPVPCNMYLMFNIAYQGIIVDYILDSEAVYLQLGEKGQRTSDLVEEPSIVVEVPRTFSEPEWNKMFSDAVYREFKRKGLSRKQARSASEESIQNLRKIRESRLKPL